MIVTSHTKIVISIIVPVYNTERYLMRCVDSILSQTYPYIELILVDDGSTDSSGRICDQYAIDDTRVHVFHGKNRGVSSARNIGIESASGEFLFFIDSDDYLMIDAISVLVEAQTKTKSDIVVGDFVKESGNSKFHSGHSHVFHDDTLMDNKDIYDYAYNRYLDEPNRYHLFTYVWGRLISSDVIKKNSIFFDEELTTSEDVAFNFECLRFVRSLKYVNHVVSVKEASLHDGYALTSKYLTVSKWQEQFGYMKAFDSIRSYLNVSSGDSGYDENKLKHPFIVYTIIQLVRIAGHINKENNKVIYQLFNNIANSDNVRLSLDGYRPSGKDSRMIPWLIRLRLVRFLMYLCRYKSNRRYQNL